MWRALASNMLTLLIVGFLALVAVIAWGQRSFTGQGPLAEPIFFEVPRGASLTRIADALEAEGAVSSAVIFRLGAQYTEREGDLKFGSYEIPAGASMADVLDILTAGGAASFRYVATYQIRVDDAELRLRERIPGEDRDELVASFAPGEPVPAAYAELVAAGTPMAYRVAIAEGVTSWQIVDALRKADFLSGEIAEVPPEGSLAPDTYEVARGGDRADIIAAMSEAQTRILAQAWAARDAELPLESPKEALILASIIEKETSVPEEREVVSSVFVNRLNRGMRLQTDPTVIYGITNGVGVLGRGLRRSELRGATPYNTYVIPGLPPTPIANPGREAIFAAVQPAETDYIFFVADGTGGHAFSRTLAEHNENVARWRAIERSREAN
ncbi:endolytic transglycosylase MltG [Dinoroseobacter sp. PD6]|uniref:endolytic transglycosylase MltG n=1 Tax=Dinoroseobacter sp. PD6 TaxID=3028384 RepID=UPI00237A2DF1|nr:endolytic transglycosylase MltG [Dinoroseobacter sp. PD6]MDD9716570.1 endolytic transglycosylase MltG [Dinoroseobacter sp. PD6]